MILYLLANTEMDPASTYLSILYVATWYQRSLSHLKNILFLIDIENFPYCLCLDSEAIRLCICNQIHYNLVSVFKNIIKEKATHGYESCICIMI